jgi:putative redox protein
MRKIRVHSEQGYQTAIHIRQHTIIADEPIEAGGTDSGPTPMEILLGTAGACIAVTTRAYAQRKGWPLEDISVELEMERFKTADCLSYVGDAPYVHEIRESIWFEGPLTEEQKQRLLVIAGKCPVHLTLENPVVFVHTENATSLPHPVAAHLE